MCKKIISVVTLAAFLCFSFSCSIHRIDKISVKTISSAKNTNLVEIVGVLLTNGKKIEFSEKNPARIANGVIIGNPIGQVDQFEQIENISILRSDIKTIGKSGEGGKITVIITTDGTKYIPVSDTVQEFPDKLEFKIDSMLRGLSVKIPVSEVDMVWVRKVDDAKAFMTVIGGAVAIGAGAIVIALATKESCPFIYSYDGEKYIFDAEPYGGAVCQGLKRTEWCKLEHIREVNQMYKIKITNEVDETQFTDEIKLLVIDHPAGTEAIPDEFGNIHTVSQPFLPLKAHDKKNREILSYIEENDWVYWQSQDQDKSLGQEEDLKEELIFEFPKPADAAAVKLIFNGCNTLWGSQMLKQMLMLKGSDVKNWYEEINGGGPLRKRLQAFILREEIYRLQIRVETKSGWKTKGIILGGGPFVSEDRVYPLDIRDVPGNSLRIKLTPPVTFWKINHLAVDYTLDIPVNISEVESVEAIDFNGQDIRDLLSNTDDNYYSMPEIGNYADLVFDAPPIDPGLKRTILLKASGYYDIHLRDKSDPQRELWEQILKETGFIVKYSLKEYQKWKKEVSRGMVR